MAQELNNKSEEDIKQENKTKQKVRELKTKMILKEFLKNNGKLIMETTIQYTKENGVGALFVTLVPGSEELDIEYFKKDDLDGKFKKRLEDNTNLNKTIYYAIRLYKNSYIFERQVDDNLFSNDEVKKI